jgi:hypothetical protein
MLNGVVEAFAEFSYTKKNFLMLFGRFRGEQSLRTLCQVLLPCTLFEFARDSQVPAHRKSQSWCSRPRYYHVKCQTHSEVRLQQPNHFLAVCSVKQWSETSGTSTACSGRKREDNLIYLLNENNPSRDFSNLTNSRVSGFSCYFSFVNRDFAGAAEKIFVDFVDGRT